MPPIGRPSRELPLVLQALHEIVAWVVVIGNGVVGLWALGAHWRPELRHPALWWCTAAAELAIFVQVGLGVALVAGAGVDVDQMHMFYGFVAIIAVAIVYSYRHQLRGELHLLYGLGSLFLMGLALRAMIFTP